MLLYKLYTSSSNKENNGEKLRRQEIGLFSVQTLFKVDKKR